MKVLTSGDLAYLDTFSGLVPCRVESITGHGGDPSTAQRITVKVTGERGAYKRGETVEMSGTTVVPRSSVYLRSGQFRVSVDWQVQVD